MLPYCAAAVAVAVSAAAAAAAARARQRRRPAHRPHDVQLRQPGAQARSCRGRLHGPRLCQVGWLVVCVCGGGGGRPRLPCAICLHHSVSPPSWIDGTCVPSLTPRRDAHRRRRRDKEPWEASDGAMYMLRELSGGWECGGGGGGGGAAEFCCSAVAMCLVPCPPSLPQAIGTPPHMLSTAAAAAAVAPASVPEFLPALAALARLQHFSHAVNLHETIWKQLPTIAENVGKKVIPGAPPAPAAMMLFQVVGSSSACRSMTDAAGADAATHTGLQAAPRGVPGPALPLPHLRQPPVRGGGGALHWPAEGLHRCESPGGGRGGGGSCCGWLAGCVGRRKLKEGGIR